MERRRILLDTDIGPDCDDAAALALCILYARETGSELLGVMHCTSSPWGVGAIRSILRWYGAEQTPVGTLKDPGFLTGPAYEKYNRPLAEEIPAEARQAPDCTRLYREILAAQPDHSVEIIGVGPLRNLANLLSSEADSVSPLSGWGLIAKKVARLTLMAGNFAPDCTGPEWNVEMDLTYARLILETWPGEINLLGWEAGADVIALREPHALSPENPVAQAYRLYAGGAGRNSWDLCTVQWAMHPDCPFYDPSAPGLVTLDAQGVSRWRPMPGGRHRFLSLAAAPEEIAADMEKTLAAFDLKKAARAGN